MVPWFRPSSPQLCLPKRLIGPGTWGLGPKLVCSSLDVEEAAGPPPQNQVRSGPAGDPDPKFRARRATWGGKVGEGRAGIKGPWPRDL